MTLQIEVFDRTGALRGRVGVYKSASLLDSFNVRSSCSFVLPAGSERAADLREPGAMVRITSPGYVFTGDVNTFTTSGPRRAALAEFTVDSHFAMLYDVLGWVQPGRAIDQQGVAGDNAVYTGAEETIVKTVMHQNALQRLGWPLSIPPSQNRGRQGMSVKFRFHPVYEKLFPITDGEGLIDSTLRWTVLFDPATKAFVVDCTPVSTFPRVLTEDSGLAEWSVTRARPTASTVVVGGAGEAQMRDFRVVKDDARIALWGRSRERFKDARDADGDPEIMYRRGNEVLEEGREKAGISVTLSEKAAQQYGVRLRVGDRVNLQLGDGQTFGPEVLREVRINYTRERGRQVSPSIGDYTDSADARIVKAVTAIARSIRKVVQ